MESDMEISEEGCRDGKIVVGGKIINANLARLLRKRDDFERRFSTHEQRLAKSRTSMMKSSAGGETRAPANGKRKSPVKK
ncbi:hypothetical protein ACG873_30245 [Mesorhizobium sp. AaZ16]|uniref:hypothetical protein n=1 Tax=Mesorhizobium sp. AaZ16 TaxID=3402289 RepID=UPI00374F6985